MPLTGKLAKALQPACGDRRRAHAAPAFGRPRPPPPRRPSAPRPSATSLCVTAPAGPQTSRWPHLAGGATREVRLRLPRGILYAWRSGVFKRETRRRPWLLLRQARAEVGRRGWTQRAANQSTGRGFPFADVSAGLKVTGRAGRHGGALSCTVDVGSSAPGLFRKPEVAVLLCGPCPPSLARVTTASCLLPRAQGASLLPSNVCLINMVGQLQS